jgi:hypothetical protein
MDWLGRSGATCVAQRGTVRTAGEPDRSGRLGYVWKPAIDKLIRWALFGVSFALLPIVFNALSAATRNQPITLELLLRNGELLLISTAIAAGAAGELVGGDQATGSRLRPGLIGLSVIVVCASSLWFADIAAAVRSGIQINEGLVAGGSIIVFVLTAITAACCIVVSELKH